MTGNMGSFRIDVELESTTRPGARRTVRALLVETGSELSWIPADILESMGIARLKALRFRQATGAIVERWTGVVMMYAAGSVTVDESRPEVTISRSVGRPAVACPPWQTSPA